MRVTGDPLSALEPLEEIDHYEPTETEKQLVSDIRTGFTAAEQAREAYMSEIEDNRLALRGDSVVVRDTSNGTVLRLSLSQEEQRQRNSDDNLLRPTNRALVGKHTRVIPSWVVLAGTADEADLRAADVCSTYMEYFFRKEGLREKYVEAHLLLGWSGTAIWKVFWDPEAGRRISYCKTCKEYVGDEDEIGDPCPFCAAAEEQRVAQQQQEELANWSQEFDQTLQAGPGNEPPQPPEKPEPAPAPALVGVQEGDNRATVHSPRTFFPEPGVVKMEDMRLWFFRESMPVTDIRERWPEMGRYIAAESGIEFDSPQSTDQLSTRGPDDHAHLYEVHEKPTAKYPRGRLIYMCRDIILNRSTDPETGEEILGEPHPGHMLPTLGTHIMRWEQNDGIIWGESHITQSKGQQRQRNKTTRQMDQHQNLTAAPPLMVPMGSHLSKSDFHRVRPAEVLKFNPMSGGKPGYLESPDFPSYTYQELERHRQSIQNKASVTDQEMGISTGDPSGRYAAFLEAQSAETILPILIINSAVWCRIGHDAITLGQHYLSDQYVWSVHGRDRVRSYNWGQANLKSGWDVVIAESDSLSQNPALRLQQAERLLEIGYFNDPATGMPDMSRFAKMAGIREGSHAPDLDSGERAYAAKLPDLILEGKFMSARPWDDARICAQELGYWLRGPGRERGEAEQQKVGAIWMAYASMMEVQTPQDAKAMPNALGQQPQSTNGGMGPGQMPQNQGVPPGDAAGQSIQKADQDAESMARQQGPHEG